jgi:hypothetical protein
MRKVIRAITEAKSVASTMMMMSFVCSCRNKIGAELHIHLEEGTSDTMPNGLRENPNKVLEGERVPLHA